MRRRSGFTLVEVLVAIVLAAICIQLAHAVAVAAANGFASAASASRRLGQTHNAHRWLRDAILHAETGQPWSGPFVGRNDALDFDTWVRAAHGGTTRVRTSIARRGTELVASQSDGGRLMLMSDIAELDVDYLLGWGAEEAWVSGWSSPTALPYAVRLRIRRSAGATQADTLLLRTGRHR